jgi:hypothetical protein
MVVEVVITPKKIDRSLYPVFLGSTAQQAMVQS